MKEEQFWKGNPSQKINILYFIFGIMFFWVYLIPTIVALYRYFYIKSWEVNITNQRIIIEKGIFNRITDEIELFRVKDIKLSQPFFLRMMGLSSIVIVTSDNANLFRNSKIFTIPAIKGGKDLREKLRNLIMEERVKNNVREIDVN